MQLRRLSAQWLESYGFGLFLSALHILQLGRVFLPELIVFET